jgi:hypothetical protein
MIGKPLAGFPIWNFLYVLFFGMTGERTQKQDKPWKGIGDPIWKKRVPFN